MTTQPHKHSHKHVASTPADPFQAALARHRGEMMALDASELACINVDVPTVSITVLAALPAMQAVRPTLVATFKNFDFERFDALESCTMALAQTHGDYVAASAPADDVSAVAEQSTNLRDAMLRDAHALAERGYLGADHLADFKGTTGFRDLAYDLIGLSSLLLAAWPTIEGHTALPRTDLETARALANKLLFGLAGRVQMAGKIDEATDLRQRAYTLFYRSYEAARAAIAYVRHDEGDAESIAPSLYTGRGRRNKDADQPIPPVEAPPNAPPADGSTPAAGTPATTANPAAPASAAHPAITLPQNSPFA